MQSWAHSRDDPVGKEGQDQSFGNPRGQVDPNQGSRLLQALCGVVEPFPAAAGVQEAEVGSRLLLLSPSEEQELHF